MAIALIMRKEDHTPDDLRRLARAPYFDANLVQKKSENNNGTKDKRRRRRSKSVKLDNLDDSDLLPSGELVHSHSIAPSTRESLEALIEHKLPVVDSEQAGPFMDAEEISKILEAHKDLKTDESVGQLVKLLRTAAELGFQVGWFEDLEERRPRGWR